MVVHQHGAFSGIVQIEAMKLAQREGQRYVADPEWVNVPISELLAKEFAARRRALIGAQALLPEPSENLHSDTVYLCAAAVALAQEHYASSGELFASESLTLEAIPRILLPL